MSDSDNTDPIATQADLDAYFSQSSSVPQDRSTPMDADVAALNDQANKQIAAGVPEDQVIAQLQQGVQKAQDKHFGKKSDKVGGDDPIASAADIDAWFANKPTPSGTPSELEDDQPYRTPNYSPQVALSPVTREAPPDKGDVPSAIPELTQKARAADAAAEAPADLRRDVGAGEGAWRKMNELAANTIATGKGALNFLGYPITAADAALSGRQVPSVTDVVADSEAPSKAESQSYALNPAKEKYTLGGEIGAGIGGGAEQLLEMVTTPVAGAAKEGASLAEQLATKLTQTAAVSSAPAANAAKDAAQQAIDNGGTPLDAAHAAMSAYESTVQGNLLPVSAEGGLAKRAITGAGIGAAQAAANGGDTQSIISGGVVGAGMGATMGHEGAPAETRSQRAQRRVQEATDQLISNTGAENANEVPQDQGGVSEAGTEPQGGGEDSGADLQQRAKAGAGADDKGEQVGQPLANGFYSGPDGYRFRVGTSSATGGIILDKRSSSGSVSAFYVGKDGNLFDADEVGLNRQQDRDRIWQPSSDEQSQAAQDILQKMGALRLNDPARADLKQQLKDLVTGDKNVDQGIQPGDASGAAQEPKAESAQEGQPEKGTALARDQRIAELNSKVKDGSITPDERDERTELLNEDRFQGRVLGNAAPIEGVANRLAFNHDINNPDLGSHVMYFDVDNFKKVNDQFGHGKGDEVIQHVGEEAARLMPGAKVYALGGDEFAVRGNPDVLSAGGAALSDRLSQVKLQKVDENGDPIGVPKQGIGISRGIAEGYDADALKRAEAEQFNDKDRRKQQGLRSDREPSGLDESSNGPSRASDQGAAPERGTGVSRQGAADGAEAVVGGEGARSDERGTAAVNERANESESVEKYRTGSESEGVTADEARQKLKSEFGTTAVRKMEAAGLKITPSSELPKLAPELTPEQRAGIKGVTTKQGQPHLIHDQTGADEIPGTVVHEIWHANADKVLPKTKQEALARAVDKVPGVRDALAKIPADTNAGHVAQEKVAYALQHLHDNSVGTRVMDAVKIGLNRLGVPKNWLDANEALIRRIGAENLRHFQETPRTFQDRGTERTEKPRVRVPVDQVPVNRVNSETSQVKENGESVTPQRVTSIKNAQVNKEREERGAELLSSVKGASNQKAMDDAKAVLDKDQDAGRRLTAELLNKPRPLNKTEVATMLRDRVRIHNELEDAYEAARNDPNNAGHVARIKDLEMQRDANDEADRRAGTENALGLQARAMMAAQDYSLVNMVKRLEVAKGEKLKPDEMEQVRKIADGIKAEKRVDNSPKEIADEFEALKKELASISKKPESQPSQAKFARAEPNVAKIIQRMAANRAAAGMPYEAAIKAIHEAVSPHADVSINDVRDAINEPKSARRQAFLGKKESDLVRRLKENDTSKGTRYKPVYNSDVNAAEGRVKALQQRFDTMKRRAEERNQSGFYKAGQTMHNLHLASILASLHVYPKLAGAVIAKYVGHGLEQATGAIAQNFPGLRGIANKATSQRVTLGGEGQYLKGIGASAKEGWQTLRRGYSDLDAKYGGKDTITDEYTDYADSLFGGMGKDIASGRLLDAGRQLTGGIARLEGRSHGAIKSFASTPKFYESYANIASKMRDDMKAQGMSDNEIQEYMSRRSTDMEIGTKAYLNALEDKMQGKNALADGINRMLVGWDQSGNAGLRGLSLLFQTVFPIRKIPLNIAKEGTSYLFGGLKAATSIAKNYAEARANGESFLDHMSGDRADYIMKNIKKQGAGAALFALGYILGPQVLGGVPQAGDKKKHLAVTPGEAEINGVQVGDSAFHSAAAQILQFGAGYRRAYESYYGKSNDAAQAGLEAFADQYGSQFVRQVPYLDQPRRWMQTAQYAPRDKRSALSEIAGNQIRSMVVPGIVQSEARGDAGILQIPSLADPDKRWPKPRNIVEDVETGIPGLRENVPHH